MVTRRWGHDQSQYRPLLDLCGHGELFIVGIKHRYRPIAIACNRNGRQGDFDKVGLDFRSLLHKVWEVSRGRPLLTKGFVTVVNINQFIKLITLIGDDGNIEKRILIKLLACGLSRGEVLQILAHLQLTVRGLGHGEGVHHPNLKISVELDRGAQMIIVAFMNGDGHSVAHGINSF